ncbi:MAG: SUMF1/EgtB/PvdO family nonheme iron enzyme [Candidatus Eisenbacteria bacterium]
MSCEAWDEDRDALTYAWSSPSGSFLGTLLDRPTIRWSAPTDQVGRISISVRVDDGDAEVMGTTTVVLLGETGDLAGTVTDAATNDPIEGAEISIAGRSTSSAADGTYRLSTVPLGNFTLSASAEGYQDFESAYEVKSGSNRQDIPLQPLSSTGRVFGTVKNAQGTPLGNATCRIGTLETTTNGSGAFSLEGIAFGSVTLQATRDGYDFFSVTRTLEGAELQIDPVLSAALPSRPAAPVATRDGTTIRIQWAPRANDAIGTVQIYQRVDGGATSAVPGGRVSATQTTFSISGNPDGRYTFRVSAINLENEEGSVSDPSNTLVLIDPSPRVAIPAGSFVMGDTPPSWPGTPWGSENHPGNPVTVGSFEIEVTEVSNRQYRAFLYEALSTGDATIGDGTVDSQGQHLLSFNASKIRYDEASGSFVIATGFESHPVVGVSWYGARAYAQHYGLRLPTEAEWEKTARGTSEESGTFGSAGVGYGTKYPWGNTAPTTTLANYGDPSGRTESVTSHPTGASTYWGGSIYNLAGNVWEWCADWYGLYQNPHQPPSTGTNKVLRGGSYREESTAIRTGARSSFAPAAWSTNSGFRCAK